MHRLLANNVVKERLYGRHIFIYSAHKFRACDIFSECHPPSDFIAKKLGDIQNFQPADQPMKLQESNIRYNNTICIPDL